MAVSSDRIRFNSLEPVTNYVKTFAFQKALPLCLVPYQMTNRIVEEPSLLLL